MDQACAACKTIPPVVPQDQYEEVRLGHKAPRGVSFERSLIFSESLYYRKDTMRPLVH